MGRVVHLLVAYDVSDDRRRTKVHKLLKGYLWPSEESVFEGSLSEEKWLEARRRLLRLLPEGNRLLVADLCPRCWAKVERYGTMQADVDAGVRWVSLSLGQTTESKSEHRAVAKTPGDP